MNILGLLLCLVPIVFFFYKFGKHEAFHISINVLMYGFYAYLWIILLIPKEHPERGDTGLGVGLFTLFSSPLFLIFNVVSIIYGNKIHNKTIMRINIVGLILCLVHIITFAILTGLI